MKPELVAKYQPYPPVTLPDRTWPSRVIDKAPRWCSVDLRDGNQALILPMTLQEKLDMFRLLVDIGFKEIEVGFPSAAQVEFDFLRTLVEKRLIPADVTVQILTQAREHLIRRSFEALVGVPRAIVHIYNSTSELQRRVVFGLNKKEIRQLAVDGVRLVKSMAADTETEIHLEYSPESFTGTELDFAREVCESVLDVWEPTPRRPVILNLPATVEMSTPNIYADQIEWFTRHITRRDCVVVSLHAHNDRGTAVAATELGLMAGGDRVEGTLFGNGERTGNVDIVTVALNMYAQGLNPGLDFHNLNEIVLTAERCTKIPVGMRHPYAGELVYTAFSGSHQDAINKGFNAMRKSGTAVWEVPYLPVDPSDFGRSYEAIIRINSQSGKGGVAYVMENEFGCVLPKAMHPEMGLLVQKVADRTGAEILPRDIWNCFEEEYIKSHRPLEFLGLQTRPAPGNTVVVNVMLAANGAPFELAGTGNGPIDAVRNALQSVLPFGIVSYSEHSLREGADAAAIAYIQIRNRNGQSIFGAGIDPNIETASVRALFSAINRNIRVHADSFSLPQLSGV